MDIKQLLAERIADAEADLTALRRALAAVDDSAPSPQPKRPRSKTTPATRDPVPAQKLVTLLRDSDGLGTAQLARQTGGEQRQILAVLKDLERDGAVRRDGERRHTTWKLVTDEDRIADRVKELKAATST